MNRTTRAVATLAVCAVVTAAVLAVADAAGAAVLHRCRTHSLAVSLASPKAAAGNEGLTVRVRNDGAVSCTVTGYPRLGLESRDGRHVKSSTTRGATYFSPDPGPSVVVLAPGETARAHLGWGDDGAHGAVRASYLTVRTRGAHSHKTVRLPYAPVRVFGGKLTVTAWKKGQR